MAKDWQLVLHFSDSVRPELTKSEFTCPFIPEPILGVRAQYPGRGAVSIKWQRATIALTALMLRIKLHRMRGAQNEPVMVGGKGSIAKILANQIYIPTSTCDILGFTSTGLAVLRRMVNVSNGRLERSAIPVQFYVNDQVFSTAEMITVRVGDRLVCTHSAVSDLLRELEASLTRISSSQERAEGVALAA